MKSFRYIVFLFLLVPDTAWPQQAAQVDQPPGDVVVTADRFDDATRDAQIHEFVDDLLPANRHDSLATFENDELCPRAIGLSSETNEKVARRMRRIVSTTQIALAARTCRQSNALLILVDDKEALIARMRQRMPQLFLDANRRLIRVAGQPGPVTSWKIRRQVTSDGLAADGSSTTVAPSRITLAVRPIFSFSIVIIERQATLGLTINQLADYAIMRLLTEADPNRIRGDGVTTILRAVTTPMGGETARSVTSWDLSFLQGLYASNKSLKPAARRNDIADKMKSSAVLADTAIAR